MKTSWKPKPDIDINCRYVDVADVFSHEMPRLRLFSELTHYMREGKISFSDAMNFCEA